MPRTVETERAKEALERDLREAAFAKGVQAELLPSLRELSAKYKISKSLVQRVVRNLCEEGLLYPVHGMGTFIGHSPKVSPDVFLFVGENTDRDYQIRRGFEDRLSALGAASLSLTVDAARQALASQSLPLVRGAWDPSEEQSLSKQLMVPAVAMQGHISESDGIGVSFDNVGGAQAATMHLITHGARSLVYLGVHGGDKQLPALDWSQERAQGFLTAAKSVGIQDRCTVITPFESLPSSRSSDPFDYFQMGIRFANHRAVQTKDVAILAANDRVAYGFLAGLAKLGMKPEEFPPIVGFDASMCRAGDYLTSVALPWSDLGRAAADLLVQRASKGPSARDVAMVGTTLVVRMSGQAGWLASLPMLFSVLLDAETEDDLLYPR